VAGSRFLRNTRNRPRDFQASEAHNH
jgi:hypothetical protein